MTSPVMVAPDARKVAKYLNRRAEVIESLATDVAILIEEVRRRGEPDVYEPTKCTLRVDLLNNDQLKRVLAIFTEARDLGESHLASEMDCTSGLLLQRS